MSAPFCSSAPFKPPTDITGLTVGNAIVTSAIQTLHTAGANNVELMAGLKRAGYPSFDVLSFQSDNGFFKYDYALFSAGNADISIAGSQRQAGIIWDRRPDTIVIIDSGGFQVATGALNVQTYFRRRRQMLRWLEALARKGKIIACGMDVPTAAARNGIPGVGDFDNCLKRTEMNIRWQVLGRTPGLYRLLNVIQGMAAYGPTSPITWYRAVKHLNDVKIYGDRAADGWAFGGLWWLTPHDLLRLLVEMYRDGMLSGRNNWFHVFGVTRPRMVGIFTLIMRAFRIVLGDPDFTISCDASNPTKGVGKGGLHYAFDDNNFVTRRLPDRPLNIEHRHRFPLSLVGGKFEFSGSFPWQIVATTELLRGTALEGTSLHSAFALSGNNANGRLNSLGTATIMYANTETYLRYVYANSDRYVAANSHIVSDITAMLHGTNPERHLSRIVFPDA